MVEDAPAGRLYDGGDARQAVARAAAAECAGGLLGINPAAMIALIAGILIALGGRLRSSRWFLFDGAWLGATLVSFGTCTARMRAALADAPRLTPSPEA